MPLVGQHRPTPAGPAPTVRLRRQVGTRLAAAVLSLGASVTTSLALALVLRLAGR